MKNASARGFNTIGRWCTDGTSENSPTEAATRCAAAILRLLPISNSIASGLSIRVAVDASVRYGKPIAVRTAGHGANATSDRRKRGDNGSDISDHSPAETRR